MPQPIIVELLPGFFRLFVIIIIYSVNIRWFALSPFMLIPQLM